jgi:hypothetical protein
VPESSDNLAGVWRAKLRSDVKGVKHEEQVAYCVENDLIGLGWCFKHLVSGTALPVITQHIKNHPDGGPQAAETIRRFAEEAQEGDFIWTRDTHGTYRLGCITGPYRYENTAATRAGATPGHRPTHASGPVRRR